MDYPVTIGEVHGYGASPNKAKSTELGQDAFLKILISQLQNQNPLEPMDDKEFISQMSTFSSLEQMEQMNNMSTRQYAQSLLGKGIMANTVLGGDGLLYSAQITGRVDGVLTIEGEQYLQLGDYRVPLSAVESVFNIVVEEEPEVPQEEADQPDQPAADTSEDVVV